MKQVTCPKCRAGKASLHLSIEHLESTKVKTLRCVACGWRESREVLPKAQNSTDRPADTASNNKRGRGAHPEALPCRMSGCPGRYMPKPNNLPLCAQHRKQMEAWLSSKRTRPAPFVENGERWIKNPAREHAIAAETQEEEMPKTRPIITCNDCGAQKPHKAKGLCDKCYDSARWRKQRAQSKDEVKPSADTDKRPARPQLLTLRFVGERDLHVLEALQAAAVQNLRSLDAQAIVLLERTLEVLP